MGAVSPNTFPSSAWPPANHPLLLTSRQPDPARGHHHWEAFLGFPLAHPPYFLSGETLSPMTVPPFLSGLEVPRAQG